MNNIKNYIGIDVSKNDFHACFNEQGEVLKFDNDKKGIKIFLKYLKVKKYFLENTVIGLESTGSYHIEISYECSQKGFLVKVINPLITNKQNQVSLRRVKTDKKDAGLIRYCLVNGAGNEFHETSDSIKIKVLVRQRSNFSMLRLRTRLRQEEVLKRENYLNTNITKVNKKLCSFLDDNIKELDKMLKKYEPITQKLLQSIPGVGPQTAVTCISEIGDIKKFKSPEKLSAWVGLDPRVHESGTSIHGKGYISKRGNKLLRTRLFNAASVAVIHPNNIFYKFFQKKRSEGKAYRVCLCAVMRKMVHVIYAVWTGGHLLLITN